MKLHYILLLAIFLLNACRNSAAKLKVTKKTDSTLLVSKPQGEWVFDEVSGSVLKFKNGKEFNTNLFELKYIGEIENGKETPFLIFSGRACDECDANISVYIHSPSNGHLEVANGENRYQYPGTERDFENDSLLYKAKAFYGQVLPGIKGVIWYQEQLMEDNSWQNSIFLINLNKGLKRDTVFKDTGDFKLTLGLLKKDYCKEIKGFDYRSEP